MDGRVLRYQELRGGKLRDYTVTFYYHGGREFKEFSATFHGIEAGACSFISSETQVIFETTMPLTAMAILPEYRQLWVDEAANYGDAWQDLDTGTETVYAGRESVSVPAGDFPDCYKTVTVTLPALRDTLDAWRAAERIKPVDYERVMANSKLTVIRWFAAGVGLVKEQLGGPDHVRELTAIVETGTGKMHTPAEQSTDELQDTLEHDDALSAEP